MAIDSRAKRASAISLAAWLAVLPPPDGSMDQGDRQHLAFTYRAIAAAEAADVHGHVTFVYTTSNVVMELV